MTIYPEKEIATPIDRLLAGGIDIILAGVLSSTQYLIPLGVLYFLLRDAFPFFDGQSIGKKVIGLRAIDSNTGAPLINNWGATVVRNVTFYIPLFNIIEVLLIFSSNGERFGDRWADTIVVKEN